MFLNDKHFAWKKKSRKRDFVINPIKHPTARIPMVANMANLKNWRDKGFVIPSTFKVDQHSTCSDPSIWIMVRIWFVFMMSHQSSHASGIARNLHNFTKSNMKIQMKKCSFPQAEWKTGTFHCSALDCVAHEDQHQRSIAGNPKDLASFRFWVNTGEYSLEDKQLDLENLTNPQRESLVFQAWFFRAYVKLWGCIWKKDETSKQ